MYKYIFSLFLLFWILKYIEENPNTILGKMKIFLVDIAEYLNSRFLKTIKNIIFILYFFYCLLIHIFYICFLPTKNDNNNFFYFILFFSMILCAMLIEPEEKEEYERHFYYDNTLFFLSNLIWLFYMIFQTIINLMKTFKEKISDNISDIKNDFYNFAISTKNIFLIPFQIAFNSYNIIESDFVSNVPVQNNSSLTTFSKAKNLIVNLAKFSFKSLKSGFSKIYSNFNFGKKLIEMDKGEKIKIILLKLYESDKKNFILLTINFFNVIFVILIIIFIFIYKLIINFLNYREKKNQQRSSRKK